MLRNGNIFTIFFSLGELESKGVPVISTEFYLQPTCG